MSKNKIFLIVIVVLLLVVVAIKESRGEEKMNCKIQCLDLIDIDECIEEELEYWKDSNRRQVITDCKLMIRNDYERCMGECANAKSDT